MFTQRIFEGHRKVQEFDNFLLVLLLVQSRHRDRCRRLQIRAPFPVNQKPSQPHGELRKKVVINDLLVWMSGILERSS
jgi:hypothetical protein